MKNLFVIMSGFILCFYAEYGWCDDPTHLIWESSYTKTPPVIDGKMEEVWERTKPLTVTVREAIGGDNPGQVVLRALHTDDTLFVMVHRRKKILQDNRIDMI
jgi:hypothetical protein